MKKSSFIADIEKNREDANEIIQTMDFHVIHQDWKNNNSPKKLDWYCSCFLSQYANHSNVLSKTTLSGGCWWYKKTDLFFSGNKGKDKGWSLITRMTNLSVSYDSTTAEWLDSVWNEEMKIMISLYLSCIHRKDIGIMESKSYSCQVTQLTSLLSVDSSHREKAIAW